MIDRRHPRISSAFLKRNRLDENRDDLPTMSAMDSTSPGNPRLALAVAVIPTIAFILHDLVFQLPDNAHEATLGFLLTIGGLLCVWAISGYIAAGRVHGAGARIIAGAVAGIASVAILWLAFVVLNGLFLERMSYEPDRIRAFQQSGYATMREWWNHQRAWGPFPFLIFFAAVAGACGGVVRRASRRRTP